MRVPSAVTKVVVILLLVQARLAWRRSEHPRFPSLDPMLLASLLTTVLTTVLMQQNKRERWGVGGTVVIMLLALLKGKNIVTAVKVAEVGGVPW